MKIARYLFTALAAIVILGSATASFACDKDQASAASAVTAKAKTANGKAACIAAGAATAAAAQCTPEMAAACKARMTAAAAKGADHCAAMKAAMISASANSGAKSSATAVTAVNASSGSASSCAKSSATAVTASAGGKEDCCMKGATTTSAKAARATKGMRISASLEGHCGGTGMAGVAARALHDDCEACLDMSQCSDALDAAGAHRQMVRLKNGVMLVYTADSPGKVNAIQAAVNSRGEHLIRFAAAGEHARLCAECKAIRAALASGKLSREVINIEGGSLTLLTSTDPPTVAHIHSMTDQNQRVAARIKS